MMRTVNFHGVAPVPVGHRVEVRWYQEMIAGLFGGSTSREEPTRPWIRDLDSGVVYATHWLFLDGGVYLTEINVRNTEVRPTLRIIETLTGKVLSCHVTTVGLSDMVVETLLTVQPDHIDGAYR